jgi:hypothetical protein
MSKLLSNLLMSPIISKESNFPNADVEDAADVVEDAADVVEDAADVVEDAADVVEDAADVVEEAADDEAIAEVTEATVAEVDGE